MIDEDPNVDTDQGTADEDESQDENSHSSEPPITNQNKQPSDKEEQDFGVPDEAQSFDGETGIARDERLENDQNFDPEDEPEEQHEEPDEYGEPEGYQEPAPPRDPDTISLVEELGVEDLFNPIYGGRGRIFSAAGPKAPVVEFTDDFVIMHPPQMPFSETGPTEDIVIQVDQRGVLLNELGVAKSVIGAKFNGNGLWYSGEQLEGTLKHYCIWFDQRGDAHKLYLNGQALTIDQIYQLRNKTHDGELSIFGDIQSD